MNTHLTPTETSVVRLRVPFAPASVSLARAQLRAWMGERSRSSERIEDARTVISEMVANSIRHGQPLPDGTILLTWCAQGQELIVSVTDGGGTTMPRAHNASPNALAGRGMSIIETISKRWWSEQTSSAATVHACLSLA